MANDVRLVAELGSAMKAEALRAELEAFFEAHAKEYDAQAKEPDFEWPGQVTRAARAFGKRYGHTWKGVLVWGDERLTGDEPDVATLGTRVVLHHDYTSGFGPDLPRALERAGAEIVDGGEQTGKPVVYARFGLAKRGDLPPKLGKRSTLQVELACGHDVYGLVATGQGTLVAAGAPKVVGSGPTAKATRGVWRKPSGGAWSLLSEEAISVADRDPHEQLYFIDTFVGLAREGGILVLVGRFEMPGKQMNMIRVSDDDGQTFRRLPAVAKGYLVATAARADARGGVFVAAQGGVLFRVSRDGLGPWVSVEAKPRAAPRKKKA